MLFTLKSESLSFPIEDAQLTSLGHAVTDIEVVLHVGLCKVIYHGNLPFMFDHVLFICL